MFNIMMRFKVVDFDRFRAAFDADDSWRRTAGEQDVHLFRDTDDPTMITLMLGWDTMDTGQLFVTSPHLRRELQDGGIMGNPVIFMVNEA